MTYTRSTFEVRLTGDQFADRVLAARRVRRAVTDALVGTEHVLCTLVTDPSGLTRPEPVVRATFESPDPWAADALLRARLQVLGGVALPEVT